MDAKIAIFPPSARPDRKIHWRCFHCDAAFTKAQERWAREHFGEDMGDLPVCQMRLPGEHHLLTALRNVQRELRRYRAEDTDLMRAIYAMRADHAQALRREEECGYEKGLADLREQLRASVLFEALNRLTGSAKTVRAELAADGIQSAAFDECIAAAEGALKQAPAS